jgi:DNA-directed RNA polymerase subunit RPC12/RpoP
MAAEEAFLCPFCGAPYRELIPVGTVQVECRYCGGTVLVPPRLGESIRRCPNHPESLLKNRRGTLLYCRQCVDKGHRTGIGITLLFGGVFFILAVWMTTLNLPDNFLIYLMVIASVGFPIVGLYKPHHPTLFELHQKKQGSGVFQT